MENGVLLPEVPKLSRYLEENFKDGKIEIAERKRIVVGWLYDRDGWTAKKIRPADEDECYAIWSMRAGRGEFNAPFFECERTRLIFRLSKDHPDLVEHRNYLENGGEFESDLNSDEIDEIIEDIATRNRGELRTYPELRDKEGRPTMVYEGFNPKEILRPGYVVRWHHVCLECGAFSNLAKVKDCFNNGFTRRIRGGFWNGKVGKRYDGWPETPFP